MASVKASVNIDLGNYEAACRALIDRINARGGINGREILTVFGKGPA
ncbi:ABC transporter substrate-binding protein (plasmid) [Embleya sp. NBC_00888]|nr:ABC transporter substrate-binding protein [Embleya sp. NBC_00888]